MTKAEHLPLGEPVHYIGDCANVGGWGHIVAVRPPDRWSQMRSYDIALDDGRTMQGIYPTNFLGSGRRFVTAAEFQAERKRRLAAARETL